TESNAFNTLGSVNVLGIMATVGLPVLYKAKIFAHRGLDISRVGALLALAVVVIINWWVLWVITITGMVAIVIFESISHKAGSKFRLARFVFPMTVMVLGVFLVIINFNPVFIKSKLPTELAPSQKLSFEVAKDVLREKPSFGYGPENFSLAFDKYGANKLGNSNLSNIKFFDSTSSVLNVAVNNGIVGLVALGFVIFLLVQLLLGILRSKSGFESENVGVTSSVVAILVAMFLYPFNLVLIFVFYLVLALFVLALRGDHRRIYNIEDRASLSMISSLGFIGGLIVALVGLYFISTNYISDIKYAEALNNKDLKKALDQAVAAINWNSSDDRIYRLASQLALSTLSAELNSKPVKGDTQKNTRVQNYLSSSVSFARRATEVSPMEPNNWINLGGIYQNLIQLVEGSDSLAEKAYLKASELRPGDSTLYNRIGSMYLLRSDLLRQLAASSSSSQQLNQQASAALIKAEDAFKKSLELSTNYGLSIYNLGIVYDRQGKTGEAIKQLEKIAPFNGDQPGLAFELGLLYYRADRKDKALEQLERAVVLSPDYANARWYLALIYEERKQIDRAVEQLEAILSVAANKGNQTVTQKLDALRAGKVTTSGQVLDQKPL
ncbi:MAG: tetratricopeptide repeat protein, partial [Candidatus Colwellbacteria bacterium]|nr:tetratricopeptide repeat protein [Candidatus Colwellbacteria bacterium]